MEQPFYKPHFDMSELGILITYTTTPGGYHPLHWHEEVELLYPLNGEIELTIEGRKHKLSQHSVAVIESSQIHSTYSADHTSTFLCIHVMKRQLASYIPDIELSRISCYPDIVDDSNLYQYYKLCKLLEELSTLCVDTPSYYTLETEGIMMQVFAHLLRYFSTSAEVKFSDSNRLTMERIRDVITYVEEHYREPISLQDVSELLGLEKETFCRFFKKNMGISFLNYVNEIRLSHVYQDLINTEDSISVIRDNNGFTNQKVFNREFKKLYGCTPSEVRK